MLFFYLINFIFIFKSYNTRHPAIITETFDLRYVNSWQNLAHCNILLREFCRRLKKVAQCRNVDIGIFSSWLLSAMTNFQYNRIGSSGRGRYVYNDLVRESNKNIAISV